MRKRKVSAAGKYPRCKKPMKGMTHDYRFNVCNYCGHREQNPWYGAESDR